MAPVISRSAFFLNFHSYLRRWHNVSGQQDGRMRVREYTCLCQNGPTPVFGGPAQENPGFHRDAPAVFQFLGADVGSPMNGWLQLVHMQPKR